MFFFPLPNSSTFQIHFMQHKIPNLSHKLLHYCSLLFRDNFMGQRHKHLHGQHKCHHKLHLLAPIEWETGDQLHIYVMLCYVMFEIDNNGMGFLLNDYRISWSQLVREAKSIVTRPRNPPLPNYTPPFSDQPSPIKINKQNI